MPYEIIKANRWYVRWWLWLRRRAMIGFIAYGVHGERRAARRRLYNIQRKEKKKLVRRRGL